MEYTDYDIDRPSTTWEWRKCKLRTGEHPQGIASPKATPPRFRRSRSRRARTSVVVQYRGGPEASWYVGVGDSGRRFPGWICLEDCLRQVLEGPWPNNL